MNVTLGEHTGTGPKCMLSQLDGVRAGRCMDGDSMERDHPGGFAQVFPCMKRWHQLFSVGTGDPAPKGSLYTTIPRHMVEHTRDNGYKQQEAHMCLGVLGRGDKDEEEWENDIQKLDEYNFDEVVAYEEAEEGQEEEEEEEAESTEEESMNEESTSDTTSDHKSSMYLSLNEWNGLPLVTTRCSNDGAIIEWLFVPFIVEEGEYDEYDIDDEEEGNDSSAVDGSDSTHSEL